MSFRRSACEGPAAGEVEGGTRSRAGERIGTACRSGNAGRSDVAVTLVVQEHGEAGRRVVPPRVPDQRPYGCGHSAAPRLQLAGESENAGGVQSSGSGCAVSTYQ